MMAARSGQCLCGAVGFAATQLRDDFGACHCKMCQRWAGAVFMAVSVPVSAIEWTGLEHMARLQTSDWAERAWCSKCGSGLWYRMTLKPDADFEVPIGLFDDANGLDLQREIFIDRKPDSFALVGDHERLTEAEVLALYGVTTEGT